MSAVLQAPMTLDTFRDWENRQEVKYEFDGFQPVAMTGGTEVHAAIQRNLIGLLYNRLRGHRCRAYGSELKIQTGDSIRYPGVFVVCSPVPAGCTLVVTDPALPEIGTELAMADIYEGVVFPPRDAAEAASG